MLAPPPLFPGSSSLGKGEEGGFTCTTGETHTRFRCHTVTFERHTRGRQVKKQNECKAWVARPTRELVQDVVHRTKLVATK